ncbi:hypothetical protein AgCh_031885 [Apium graveolens]
MADYFAMCERQEKEAADVVVATESGTKNQNDRVSEIDFPDKENEEVEAVEVPKRLRGVTRMDKVHTRPFEKKVLISMNEKFQHVSDNEGNIPEDQKACDGLVFFKTRKRKPGREYKTNTDVMNYRIVKGVDGIEESISRGKKSHAPGWLIGRHDTKSVKNATEIPAPTNLVDDEVEAKVSQKVQDNLTFVLKKLVEANPGLKIDIAHICGTVSSNTRAAGTPLTAGPNT